MAVCIVHHESSLRRGTGFQPVLCRLKHGLETRATWAGTILLTALLLFAPGCGPSKQQLAVDRAVSDYFIGDYEHARDELRPMAEVTDEDFVLNNVRLGSACIVDYHLDEAEGA